MPHKLSFPSRSILSFVLLFLLATISSGQTAVSDLLDAIASESVTLNKVSGNGNSTGSALTGVLVNNTDRSIAIKVNLRIPLFFVNNGPRQNMFALQVYEKDGSYVTDGENSFIELDPKGRLDVIFNALCADFERDNPTSLDSFKLGFDVPAYKSVLAKIAKQYETHPDDNDLLEAAQAALWMAQGVSITEIRKRFDVSDTQERLARSFF